MVLITLCETAVVPACTPERWTRFLWMAPPASRDGVRTFCRMDISPHWHFDPWKDISPHRHFAAWTSRPRDDLLRRWFTTWTRVSIIH